MTTHDNADYDKCDAEGCENPCERVRYVAGRRVLLCVGHAVYLNNGIVPPLRAKEPRDAA